MSGPQCMFTFWNLITFLSNQFLSLFCYSMSSLHVWFSKLKWNMDVLLRFYERHAFICALHKETRLLFDELVFCLQRLYSVPIHIDLPFSSDLIDDIPLTSSTPTSAGSNLVGGLYCCSQTSAQGCMGQKNAYDSNHCFNCVCSTSTSAGTNSSQSPHSGGTSNMKRRPLSATSKSRIPRPISLPKRLESKLSSAALAVNIRQTRQSPVRGSKDGQQPQRVRASPTAGPVRPTMSAGDRKSRVRDTVKLFDSRTSNDISSRTSAEPKLRTSNTPESIPSSNTARRSGSANVKRHSLKSPKTGAGEAMALEDTGGRR